MSRHRRDEDVAWRDYTEHFRTVVFPQIVSSEVFLTIYSGDGSDFDVKQATELGAMLLLDKPLLVIVAKGSRLPTRLAKAADIVVSDFDVTETEAQEKLAAAIATLQSEQERSTGT